jgi:copper chaperone CopZ
MRKVALVSLVLLLLGFLPAGVGAAAAEKKQIQEVTFSVNMHCDSCKERIQRSLTWHKGVKDLDIKLKALTVRVRFDPRKTSVEDLQEAITGLGYVCEAIPQAQVQP